MRNFPLTFSIFLLTFSILHSQPKLVVGIVVDQMRNDYIEKYWSKFGERGVKRLLNDGYNFKNTFYNYIPTYTGPGHASIFTGTTPSQNGIAANTWYDVKTKTNVYCVIDNTVQTIGGSETAKNLSPKNLLSITIGDKIKLLYPQAKVIGVALKDRGAILAAGQKANAAYWYDGKTGNWVSSTYYMKELPKWVIELNELKLAQKYLKNIWSTLLPIDQYTESISDDNDFEQPFKPQTRPVFPYNLLELAATNDNLELIRSTPWGNTLTTDFAISAIKNEKLGDDSVTDMLTISFSSTDYIGHQFGPTSVEVEDTYLRLDKDIETFLNFLDKEVGKDKYLMFLTADHGASDNVNYMKSKNISAGFYDEKEIEKKLKTSLSKQFADSLIYTVMNGQVYVMNDKIEKMKLDKEKVYSFITEKLKEVKGVKQVYTENELSSHNGINPEQILVKNGYLKGRSGNIFIVFEPNWMGIESKLGTTHGSGYEYDTHVPFLLYGYAIPKGQSTKKQKVITDIAPTVIEIIKPYKPFSKEFEKILDK